MKKLFLSTSVLFFMSCSVGVTEERSVSERFTGQQKDIDDVLTDAGSGFLTQEFSVTAVGPNGVANLRLYYKGEPFTTKEGYCFQGGVKGKLDTPNDFAGFAAAEPLNHWILGARVVGNEGAQLNVWGRCFVYK